MKKCFSIIVVLLLCFPLVIAAGEKKKQKVAETMDEVVVTATKTKELKKDVPNSVIVIDSDDISQSSAKNIGQLLSNDLGIDIRTYGDSGGAASSIQIRGMGADGTYVMLDGVNINSPSIGSCDINTIPIDSIQKIEIVKGSGSLLYGSGAMGGTVNIITKNPTKHKTDIIAKAGYGTQNTYRLSIEQGMYPTKNLGYYVTANHDHTDGFRDNSDMDKNNLSAKLLYDKDDNLDLSLYGNYMHRNYGSPGIKPPNGTKAYYKGNVEFYDDTAASLLDNNKDDTGLVIFKAKSNHFNWLDIDFKTDYLVTENYSYVRYNTDGTGQKSWIDNEVLGTEITFNIKPFENIDNLSKNISNYISDTSLLLGFNYKNYEWTNKTQNLDSSGNDTGPSDSTKANYHTMATYIEAQVKPIKYIKLLAGIRNENNSAFGSINIPRYGLILYPLEHTTIKTSYGEHFLAPTPNDLYWPTSLYTKGNPNLRPETGWSYDVTLNQSFLENKLGLTFSYFHWSLKDKIQWMLDDKGVSSPVNLDEYKSNGVEIGTQIGPFYNVELAIDYTYTYAKAYNHDPAQTWTSRRSQYTPTNQFKAAIVYYLSYLDLTANLTTRYTGDRLWYAGVNNGGELDSYWLTDVKIKYPLNDYLTLNLIGENIFNQGYNTYAGVFFDENFNQIYGYYPGASRAFYFNLTFEY